MFFFLRLFISDRADHCTIIKKIIIKEIIMYEIKNRKRTIKIVINFQ